MRSAVSTQGQNPWRRYDYKIPKAARVGFFAGMPPPDDLDCLSHAELKGLVVKQWEQMVELQRLVAALRDEIARLKGGPGRPNLKPSGMERGTEPKPPGTSDGRKRPRGSTRSKLVIDEERTVTVAAPPRGSRGAAANRHRWSLRAGTAPLRARPISSRADDGAASGDAVARVRHCHLQASGHAPADQWPGRLLR